MSSSDRNGSFYYCLQRFADGRGNVPIQAPTTSTLKTIFSGWEEWEAMTMLFQAHQEVDKAIQRLPALPGSITQQAFFQLECDEHVCHIPLMSQLNQLAMFW